MEEHVGLKTKKTPSFPTLLYALYPIVLVFHIIGSYTEHVEGTQNLKREERLPDGD